LLDLAWCGNELANLTNIKWVIVTLRLGLRMDGIRVFPSLGSSEYRFGMSSRTTYLRKSSIIPEVAFVGKAIADIA